MASYYYLGSQLPALSWGQSAPLSVERFLSLAESGLDAEDYAGLLSLDDVATVRNAEAFPDFIRKWTEWNMSLVKNIAKYRAQRLQTLREGSQQQAPQAGEAPDYPASAVNVAKAACAAASPLEAELLLD
jgi:hypothetical protein